MVPYEYRYELKRYGDSCPSKQAKKALKKIKVTVKSMAILLCHGIGELRRQTSPSSKSPKTP
jgi:hypothetical protein